MPVGSNYADVDQGSMICRVVVKPDTDEDYMILAINMGDLTADYMVTYYNYYGVQPGTEQYDVIAASNIQKSLATAFAMESIFDGSLKAAAEAYLAEIGLSAEEIAAVQANLGQ